MCGCLSHVLHGMHTVLAELALALHACCSQWPGVDVQLSQSARILCVRVCVGMGDWAFVCGVCLSLGVCVCLFCLFVCARACVCVSREGVGEE